MRWLKRLGQMLRELFGISAPDPEERDPEAVLEKAKQAFRNKMAEHNRALARIGGIAERLKNQIETKTARAIELEKRVLANCKVANTELAGSLARELQEIKADLQGDARELEDAEAAYQSNLNVAKIVQKEFEEKVKALERHINRVELEEAQAEASSALEEVASFDVDDIGDTLNNLEVLLDTKRVTAAARARVAKDLGVEVEFEEQEAENKALEQRVLSDFLARHGVAKDEVSPTRKAAQAKTPATGVSDS